MRKNQTRVTMLFGRPIDVETFRYGKDNWGLLKVLPDECLEQILLRLEPGRYDRDRGLSDVTCMVGEMAETCDRIQYLMSGRWFRWSYGRAWGIEHGEEVNWMEEREGDIWRGWIERGWKEGRAKRMRGAFEGEWRRGRKRMEEERWWKDGVLKQRVGLDLEGRKEGVWERFYPNGSLHKMGEYRRGIHLGRWVEWWENGLLKWERRYDDEGRREGRFRWWDVEGRSVRMETWERGERIK